MNRKFVSAEQLKKKAKNLELKGRNINFNKIEDCNCPLM